MLRCRIAAAGIAVAGLAGRAGAGGATDVRTPPSIVFSADGSSLDRLDYFLWATQEFGRQPTEDAALTYQQADAAGAPIPDFDALQRAASAPWTDQPSVDDWLAQSADAIRLYTEAAGRPECYVGFRRAPELALPELWRVSLAGAVVPGLGVHRTMPLALLAKGWRASGDPPKPDRIALIGHAVTAVKAARHLDGEPMIVSRLIAANALWYEYRALLRAVDESDDPGALAATLLERLAPIDGPLPDLTATYVCELAADLDLVQRLFERTTGDAGWPLEASAERAYAVLPRLANAPRKPAWDEFQRRMEEIGRASCRERVYGTV